MLEVEETRGPNNMVNSYDAPRPMAWYKESMTYDDDNNSSTAEITVTGFRSFYTAKGHNSSDYSSNSNFRTLLKNATLWAIGSETLGLVDESLNDLKVFPNPVQDYVSITMPNLESDISLSFFNELGQIILNKKLTGSELKSPTYILNIENFKTGTYIIQLSYDNQKENFKFIKN